MSLHCLSPSNSLHVFLSNIAYTYTSLPLLLSTSLLFLPKQHLSLSLSFSLSVCVNWKKDHKDLVMCLSLSLSLCLDHKLTQNQNPFSFSWRRLGLEDWWLSPRVAVMVLQRVQRRI